METLIDAIQRGNIKSVYTLIKAGTDVNQATEDGWTPLMYATHHECTEIVEELIKARAIVQENDYACIRKAQQSLRKKCLHY
ncbi:ankyrin repeat domain-containing protein [Pseudomonadota bacterium]